MKHYADSTGLWYKDGVFYELEDHHINFFLAHPEILGFTQAEKQQLCIENGLKPDAVFCEEASYARNNILIDVLKRGAVRIRFYKGQTSVQCGSKDISQNLQQLKKCIAAGWEKCFGNVVTVKDTYGWNQLVTDIGYGLPVIDFCGEEIINKPKYQYLKYKDLMEPCCKKRYAFDMHYSPFTGTGSAAAICPVCKTIKQYKSKGGELHNIICYKDNNPAPYEKTDLEISDVINALKKR